MSLKKNFLLLLGIIFVSFLLLLLANQNINMILARNEKSREGLLEENEIITNETKVWVSISLCWGGW